MMRFAGRIYKDGKFWLAEVPLFDAMTQGRTRREALRMIQDWFESMASLPGFAVTVHDRDRNHFEVSATDTGSLTALLLQRGRTMSGLSLAEVAARLGVRSRNAYARYEQGRCTPTIDKLDELLRAVSPGTDFIIQESPSAYGDPKPPDE